MQQSADSLAHVSIAQALKKRPFSRQEPIGTAFKLLPRRERRAPPLPPPFRE